MYWSQDGARENRVSSHFPLHTREREILLGNAKEMSISSLIRTSHVMGKCTRQRVHKRREVPFRN